MDQFLIQLKQVIFNDINFKVDEYDVPLQLDSTLSYRCILSEKSNKEFSIIFDVRIADKNNKLILTLKTNAIFDVDKEISSEFTQSNFAKINAPAIAFPYIRTFVTNFTLNCGLVPLFMPTFNFVKMAEIQALQSSEEQKAGH